MTTYRGEPGTIVRRPSSRGLRAPGGWMIPTVASSTEEASNYVSADEAIRELRAGRSLVVTAHDGSGYRGSVIAAARSITAEAVNFMAKHARGLICVPMTEMRAAELNLPPMIRNGTSAGAAFTVTVEAALGVTTGISAHDRARTIQVLADPASCPQDITRPGHILPIRIGDSGVLGRAGEAEASVDLCKLAGIQPVAVVCEIMNDDGSMAEIPDLECFAERHALKILPVAEVVAYRFSHERLVDRVEEIAMPTRIGDFRSIGYRTLIDSREHMALVMGDVSTPEPVLVHVHEQCVIGDVFGSLSCDCGEQLDSAMYRIAEAGRGVIIYMDQGNDRIDLRHRRVGRLIEARGGNSDEDRRHVVSRQIIIDLGVRQVARTG